MTIILYLKELVSTLICYNNKNRIIGQQLHNRLNLTKCYSSDSEASLPDSLEDRLSLSL